MTKNQEEMKEIIKKLPFELPTAIESLDYQIIHASYNINVSSFIYKDVVEEPSDEENTLDFIKSSICLNNFVLITFRYLKR